MADLILEGKREAIAQGYAYWVQSVTGSKPKISRTKNGRQLNLSEGQIQGMSNNIHASMTAKSSPGDLNVSMPWGAILMPAMTKLYWPYALGAVVFIGGIGYVMGSGGGSKKRRKKRR